MYNDLTKLNGVCGGADVTMQHGIYASDVIGHGIDRGFYVLIIKLVSYRSIYFWKAYSL